MCSPYFIVKELGCLHENRVPSNHQIQWFIIIFLVSIAIPCNSGVSVSQYPQFLNQIIVCTGLQTISTTAVAVWP